MRHLKRMANPQKENGYTPIANELLEQMLLFDFSKRQLAVLLAIVRMTYGYSKKSDALSSWKIQEMTRIDRSHVSKTINELVEMNVIIRHEEGRISHGVFVHELSINKHYDEWLTVANLATVNKTATVNESATEPSMNCGATVYESATEPSTKQPTHKAIKTISKTNKTIKAKTREISLKTYLELCQQSNEKPIPENDTVFQFVEEAKIPMEFLRLAWLGFKDEFFEKEDKKQKCWRQAFRNYVRNDYLKVWAFDRNGVCYLTTKGVALQNRFGEQHDG